MPQQRTPHPIAIRGPEMGETSLQQHPHEPRLERGLRQRHVTMIGSGGIIGAGLFVGSGAVMHQAGPAAVVSYGLAGIIVMLTMRMLGEMAVARPTTGSFVEYARAALANWRASRPAGCTGTSGSSCSRSRRWPAPRSSRAGCPASRSGSPRWR